MQFDAETEITKLQDDSHFQQPCPVLLKKEGLLLAATGALDDMVRYQL